MTTIRRVLATLGLLATLSLVGGPMAAAVPVARTGAAAPAAPAPSPPAPSPPAPSSPAPGVQPSPSVGSPRAPAAVAISLDRITPAALTPGSTLEVTGWITNTGPLALSDLTVRLAARRARLTVRSDLDAWMTGDPAMTSTAGVHQATPVPGTLAPRSGVRFSLKVPASQLRWPGTASAFGSYGIAVEVLADSAAGSRQRVGIERTLVVWYPGKEFVPTRLTLLAPVTSGIASAGGQGADARLVASMASGGRLQRLVQATGGGSFAWAVDPALLSQAWQAQAPAGATSGPTGPTTVPGAGALPSAPVAPGTATTGAGVVAGAGATGPTGPAATATATASASASAWLSAVRTALPGLDATALPYGDPDVAALAHGGGAHLLPLARSEGEAAAKLALGSALPGSLAWPVDGLADAATLSLLARSGSRAAVLAGSTLPPAQEQNYTPGAPATVPGGGGISGLVYDATLSAQLAGIGGDDTTQATQRLLAELATITTERPGQSRYVLAVAPRDWNPDPVAVQRALATLSQAPWAQVERLSTLLAEKPGDPQRTGPVYPEAARAAELPGAHVTAVAQTEQRLEDFTPALTVPQAVVPGARHATLSLVGTAWRSSTSRLAAARAPLTAQVDHLYQGISVLTGRSKLLVAQAARLPLTLENQLDQPVRVMLSLHPRSGRLQARPVVGPILIGAHGLSTVRVPIRALANGDVLVEASLLAPSRARPVLHAAEPFVVRVHSDWENRALAIAGAVLGLLVLRGLIRGVRRGRRRLPPESVPDPDEEAVRRETRERAGRSRRRRATAGGEAEAEAEPGSATKAEPGSATKAEPGSATKAEPGSSAAPDGSGAPAGPGQARRSS